MTRIPEFDPLTFNTAALRLRGYRHQILASNLANADTPGYKARDIAFEAALNEQLQGRTFQPRLQLASTHGRHLGSRGAGDGVELLYRTSMQPAIDGNTVDPDIERAHFAENTMGFEAAVTFLASTVRSRQMAISGNP